MMDTQLGTSNHHITSSNETTNTSQSFVRKRTRATAEQLAVLEDTFAVNVSPNSKLRKQLAEKLKMNERSIQIWFQNRRAKVKQTQKRAHMQIHQAAMKTQFYHHYSHPFDNDLLMKQPFYFPPRYMMKQPITDYNLMKSTPESPMYYNTPPPPPPHFHTSQKSHWRSSAPPSHSSLIIDSDVSYEQQLFEKDFLTLDLGFISPSSALKKDESSPSTTSHENELFSMPSNLIEDKITPESSLYSESEIWISTPESFSDSLSNPCHPSFPPSSSSTVSPSDLQNDGLTVAILMIGTWQRIKYPASDLTCCYDGTKFVWLIEEGGHQFKIEIPIHLITKIDYASSSDTHLYLSHPPLFYIKSDTQGWIQCGDFTENKQASHYLCHTLKGPHLHQDLMRLVSIYPGLSKLVSINSDINI